MGGDTGEFSCSHHTLSSLTHNMRRAFRVDERFRQSKVNNEDRRSIFPIAHHKVIGFEVSMNIANLMESLESAKYLMSNPKYSGLREMFMAK